MSYDIDYHSSVIDVESLSPTYNIGAMLRAALHALPKRLNPSGDVRSGAYGLHGLTGAEARPALDEAVRWMSDPANAATIAEMEPSNGWGSSGNARGVLSTLLGWALGDPQGVFDSEYGQGLTWRLERDHNLIPEEEGTTIEALEDAGLDGLGSTVTTMEASEVWTVNDRGEYGGSDELG